MRLIALLVLTLASIAAAAQPYVAATYTAIDADQSDAYVMPSIGYRFGRLSLEASYLSADFSSSTVAIVGPIQTAGTRTDNELEGPKLSLMYAMPFGNRVEGFAVVSAYRLKSDIREVDTLTTFGPNGPIGRVVTGERSASESGTTLSLGAGLSFEVLKSLAIRWSLELGRGKDALRLDDFLLVNIGAAYRF